MSAAEAAVAAGGLVRVEAPSPDWLRLHLCGDWLLSAHLPSATEVEARLNDGSALRRVSFDTSELGEWDTALLSFLVRICKGADARDLAVDTSGLPEGAQRLLNLAFAVPERKDAGRGGASASLLVRLGESVIGAWGEAREFTAFLGEATLSMGRFLTGRARLRRSDLAVAIQECGAEALPIVGLISILIGLILAFVGAMQLRLFGAEIFIADLVGIGMAREMGAMMAAIIMAGRTGAAFAAQLGTMTVNEEIDALKTLGVDPMDFLVLPRMVALILMMPLLTVYANLLGIAGGAAVAVLSFDITWTQYWGQTQSALTLTHFGVGIFKSAVFGVLVALSGCLRGMQCGRSASAVGEAATSAVVTAIVWIIVFDSLITVIATLIGI